MAKRFTTGMAPVEPQFILWRKVRFPLAAGIVVILLVVSGFLLRSYLISRDVRNELIRATELVAVDTFESHRDALELLQSLRIQYPDYPRIRVSLAWHRVLRGLRYGTTNETLTEAHRAVEGLTEIEASCLQTASRAGLEVLDGELERALETVGEEPRCREGLFVRAVATARHGETDAALALLDQARRGEPVFVPALGELVLLLRQRGRFTEASNALEVLTKVAPSHEDGLIQGILLTLDANADNDSELSKQVVPLTKRLATVEIGSDAPRTLAHKRFADGRLAFLRGELDQAEEALSAAAEATSKSQPVATWLATTRRRARQHTKALKAIEAFPDEASTNVALLRTRLDILLDLGRTNDAASPMALLSKTDGVDVSSIRARILVDQAAGERAVEALSTALEKGDRDAGFDLAETYVELGKSGQAQRVLSEIGGTAGQKACAAGMRHWMDGNTAKARQSLQSASKAGARCGPRLAGRLLLDAGLTADHIPALVKALEEREDARDRVLLGRMKLRFEGAEAALTELKAVEAGEPQAVTVLHELAEAYREMGQLESASKIAALGVDRTKGHPLLVAISARLARESKQLKQAEQLVAAGLKMHRSSPQLNLERAAILAAQRRYPEAEAVANEAMQPGPHFADAACLRANVQLRRGDREGAQVELRRNIAPSRRHSGVAAQAGIWACLVEFHLKRGPSALTRAKTAMFYLRRFALQSSTIEYLDGQVALRDNRPSDALSRFRMAIELDPVHREAWRQVAKSGRLTAAERQRFQKIFPGRQPQDH